MRTVGRAGLLGLLVVVLVGGGFAPQAAAQEDDPVDVFRQGPSELTTEPGARLQPRVAFVGRAAEPLRVVRVTMWTSPGLAYQQEHSNCQYRHAGEGGRRFAVCLVKGRVEAGRSYDLRPGALIVAEDALNEEWVVSVGDNDSRDIPTYLVPDPVGWHRGTGPELTFAARPTTPTGAAEKVPLAQQTVRVSRGVAAADPVDFAAIGADVDGKEGRRVRVEVGFRNLGPASVAAWMGDEPGDEPTVTTRVDIPPGTTAVRVPQECVPVDSPGARNHGKLGKRAYYCFQRHDVLQVKAGERTPFAFDLRIDDPAELAAGKVTLEFISDRDHRNNTDRIAVTSDGKTGADYAANNGRWLLAGLGSAVLAATLVLVRRRRGAR